MNWLSTHVSDGILCLPLQSLSQKLKPQSTQGRHNISRLSLYAMTIMSAMWAAPSRSDCLPHTKQKRLSSLRQLQLQCMMKLPKDAQLSAFFFPNKKSVGQVRSGQVRSDHVRSCSSGQVEWGQLHSSIVADCKPLSHMYSLFFIWPSCEMRNAWVMLMHGVLSPLAPTITNSLVH